MKKTYFLLILLTIIGFQTTALYAQATDTEGQDNGSQQKIKTSLNTENKGKKKNIPVDGFRIAAGVMKITSGSLVLLVDFVYLINTEMVNQESKTVPVDGTSGGGSQTNGISGEEIAWVSFFALAGAGLVFWGINDCSEASGALTYNKPLIYPYMCRLNDNSYCYGISANLKF